MKFRIWKFRIRKDHYHGWQLMVDGCPRLFQRLRMVYRGTRYQRGWNRRVSAAVALWTVFGWMDAFRYASGCGYPSALNAESRVGKSDSIPESVS